MAAADRALAQGTIEPLRGLIEPERWAELERRFQHALALNSFDDDDLQAARTFMDAYVSFFKYAEGEEHDAHSGHGRDHDEHAQEPGHGQAHGHDAAHAGHGAGGAGRR